jgi:hypothetical protein
VVNQKVNIIVRELERIKSRSDSLDYKDSKQESKDNKMLDRLAGFISINTILKHNTYANTKRKYKKL